MDEIQGRILRLFGDAVREHGPLVHTTRADIAADLGVEQDRVKVAFNTLRALGLMEPMTMGGADARWRLTDDGVRHVITMDEPPPQQTAPQVFHIGSIEGHAVNVGGTQYNVNVESMIAAFERVLATANIPEEEKKGLLRKFLDFAKHPAFVAILPEFVKLWIGSKG